MKFRPYNDVPISEIKPGDLIRVARYVNSRTWQVKEVRKLPDGYTLVVQCPRKNTVDYFWFDSNKRIYRGEK